MLDVSGHSGGGKILVGGDYGGGRPIPGVVNNQSAGARRPRDRRPRPPSRSTPRPPSTPRRRASGNGGKVILWSDVLTTFAGTIFARGGEQGGNGGFVEVSGKQQLAFTGTVDTRAPNGTGRHAAARSRQTSPSSDGGCRRRIVAMSSRWTPTTSSSRRHVAGTAAIGDITVNAPITWAAGNSLTLERLPRHRGQRQHHQHQSARERDPARRQHRNRHRHRELRRQRTPDIRRPATCRFSTIPSSYTTCANRLS